MNAVITRKSIVASEPFLSNLGLGCSRIGSVAAGLSSADVHSLIDAALDSGVTAFDTSDIYGQGDSERLIGRALRGLSYTFVSTKAGQRFHWSHRAVIPLKAAIALAHRRIPGMRRRVQAARAQPLLRCFEPDYLTRALHGSLRRLDRDFVDAFYLHDPDVEVVKHGEAVDRLARLKERGLLRHIGVSTDSVGTVRAALADGRVSILQIPVSLVSGPLSYEIAARRALLVCRGVLGGPHKIVNPAEADSAIAAAVSIPNVACVLVGATKPYHIAAAARVARMTLTNSGASLCS